MDYKFSYTSRVCHLYLTKLVNQRGFYAEHG